MASTGSPGFWCSIIDIDIGARRGCRYILWDMFARPLAYVRQFESNLWILCIGWFVGALGFAAAIPFLSIYFHDHLKMSVTEIGLFFGAMAVVRAGFQLVGGEVSDRMSRKTLLVYAQILRAVSFVLLGLAIDYDMGFWPIAIFMTMNSTFGAIYFPAQHALVSDILTRAQRLDGYALTRSAGNLGWAAGPAIGGFMAHSSYAGLFYIAAAILFTSGLIFLFWFRAPNQVQRREEFTIADLVALKNDRRLTIHCLLSLALYLVVAQLMAPFSVYAVQVTGLSEIQLGYLYTVNGLLVGLAQIMVTRMLGNTRFTSQLALGAVFYFIGYGVLGFSTHYAFMIGAIAVVTSGEMIMSPPTLTLTSRLAPPDQIGRYMGIYTFFMTLGWSLGPLYGGWFLDSFAGNYVLAWIMIASLALVASVGFLWFGRRLDPSLNR
ncbi:MAG: MFS transporter [Candidatus Zixiibacteriota bacterium]